MTFIVIYLINFIGMFLLFIVHSINIVVI